MPYNAELVILANSVKFGKHCVAGKLVNTHQWIRLVSNERGAELDNSQVRVATPRGNFPVFTLEQVYVNILQRVPLINQPENCLLDIHTVWQRNGRLYTNNLGNYLDNPLHLWGEGDRLSYSQMQNGQIVIQNSLFLVQVRNLALFTRDFQGKVRRRATFQYNNIVYDLSVTDPKFDNLMNTNNNYQTAVLCISLGEPAPFDNNCYKIIASIFV
ncbi:hypothetical protein FEF33_08475 [Moraxella osloensis]|nr:hypothetical protein FEF33_08475 [Moraxella osloensis]